MLPIDHRALFDAMPIPRLIMKPQEDGRITVADLNVRAQDYFNRKKDQLIGKTVADIMDSENARHFQQSFEVSLKHRMPVTIQAVPSFPGTIRVHGFWINPVMDERGDVVYLDITAQPDATNESILQRERDDAISLLTSIFDASEVGIIVTDHNRRIVRVNDAFVRTFGWSRDTIIGEDVLVLSTVDEVERLRANHDDFIGSGKRSTGEMKVLRRDGSISNALFTTAMLELSQRRRFLVTTIMDITVRKQMEISLRLAKEQADAANHAKSSFLANMSHELRTPLNAIIGFSELMMKETFGPLGHAKYIEYLGDVHFSARHLLEIINEVLDMSKIEAGRVELDESDLDLAEVVMSVIRIMTSRAFSSDIDLIPDLQANLPHLYADTRLVRQILINLISNAVKFSKPGDKIFIKAHALPDGDIQVVVQDFGVGIPKDKIKDAMEPFGQIHDSVHSAQIHQGTGLGLPLARAMVELHGGNLTLDSDLGQGTTVYVTFPALRVLSGKYAQRRMALPGKLDPNDATS
jgi:two-component system, cell cycle sensor histidine kinase PleC